MAMVPAGVYKGRAAMPTNPELEVIRWADTQGGHKQCVITMEITDGPQKGKRLPWQGFFTPLKPGAKKSGTDIAIASLRAMGWTGDDLADICSLEHVPNEVEMVVEMEDVETTNEETGEVETKQWPRIRWINPVGGRDRTFKKPIAREDLRAWSAQMKSSLAGAAVPGRAGADAPPADPYSALGDPAGYEDDIPF